MKHPLLQKTISTNELNLGRWEEYMKRLQPPPRTTLTNEINVKLEDYITHPIPFKTTLRSPRVNSATGKLNVTHQRTKDSTHKRANQKVDHFHASLLKIDAFKYVAEKTTELGVGWYYGRKKVVWDMADKENYTKHRIEIQWRDILAIRVVIEENKPGILEI
ncbi:hypothetical protein VNO77_35065 [Canavalia gladiata]|uniref:TRF2/HOY1 PH-like domain-containing protein n=1 Tax=Canavalia gladiata TaxID=3824 RepID=A0AAN9KFR5_CANGL